MIKEKLFFFTHPVRDEALGRKCTPPSLLHPVKDASLTGCKVLWHYPFSTERYIPDGMLLQQKLSIQSKIQRATI